MRERGRDNHVSTKVLGLSYYPDSEPFETISRQNACAARNFSQVLGKDRLDF